MSTHVVASLGLVHAPATTREDQHSGADQLVAHMGGWTGIPRARSDPGSFGQDVVTALGDLAQIFDCFVQVAALGGVSHCSAVEGAVEELLGRRHGPAYRISVLHIRLSAVDA